MNFQSNIVVDTVLQAFPLSPLCASPETTIREAFETLRSHRRGCLLICQDQRLVGIFTERDALRLMVDGTDFQQPIRQVMQHPVATAWHDETVGDAVARMSEGGFRQLPILNDAREPVGILTVRSILRYLVEHFPGVVYTLPPEPHYVVQGREGA